MNDRPTEGVVRGSDSERTGYVARDGGRAASLRSVRLAACAFLVVPLAVACATTQQVRHVHEAGALLEDPSVLRAGTGSEPKLYYVDSTADWSGYDKLIVDPVMIWKSKDSGIKVSQQDAQHIANQFQGFLTDELSKDFEIVSHPGPGTLRLTVMLVDLHKTRVVLNVVSTIMIPSRVATSLQGLVTGKPAFTGEVGMAFKCVDSSTNGLLSAGVTERAGTKHIGNAWKTWQDVDDGLHFWSEQFRYDLCENRGGQDCEPPKSEKTP
jgi:hypothetical protein